MQGCDDRSTRNFRHVFLPAFLDHLHQRDEPPTAAEADVAGPWRVEEIPATLYAVFRADETAARGDRPVAVFTSRAYALLAAALLPGTGRDALFHLQKDPGPSGYAIETGGEVIGHLAHFDEKLVERLHGLECLLRSPEALANVFEAAGAVVLERVGAILERRFGGLSE